MKKKNKRNKSKKQSYYEIINLEVELKEYRKLCKCKSEKFTYYLEWKKHIFHEFSKLDNLDRIENFKHYLINKCRGNKSIYTQLVPIMIFYFTIILDKVLPESVSILFLICIVIVLFYILLQNDYYNKGYYFYRDVLEILEEVYEKEKNKCPTQKPATKKP